MVKLPSRFERLAYRYRTHGAPFAIGDRVMTTTAYATGWGGFAEYCLADATRVVLAHSHMTDVEAAGFLSANYTQQLICFQ
jgi:NADPH:quinone reductase-like Zn-dependent oxidoreductase